MEEKKMYSPMVNQYLQIKENYQDTLILFRLGDFYELFFEDAKIASKVLELVLTSKSAGENEKIPMCGVPYHAINSYIETLIKAGYKVGIVEQLEDPATVKKGIVKRDVIQVITPGTLIDLGLDEKSNNYIAYVDDYITFFTVSYCDLSTGELNVFNIEHDIDLLIGELNNLEVKELVTTSKCKASLEYAISKRTNIFLAVSEIESMPLEIYELTATLQDARQVETVSKLVFYLTNTQKRSIEYLKVANVIKTNKYMKIDNNTSINLELTRTIKSADRYGSLFYLLDKTKTAMGARCLKKFISKPLTDLTEINNRLDIVETLSNNYLARNELRTYLDEVYDLERLIAKISYGNANARDLLQLEKSFLVMPSIKEKLNELKLSYYADKINSLTDLTTTLANALVDNPPLTVKEGNMIKDGFNQDLDDLRFVCSNGKGYLASIEAKEKERTGIKNLRIGYNNVFGYYIEVSKGNLSQVKDEYGYIRKQTTVNSERFITEELKEKERMILSASDKTVALEYEIFTELKNKAKKETRSIQETADVISYLDVLLSFAEVSNTNNFIRPTFNDNYTIKIVEGRHPVMDTLLKGGYIPNDVNINDNEHLIIISGPNMGGKSTFMRQVAITSIMAQMGCFVAASEANLPLFDGIYTRIGASDDMISGQSTFMVEMNEVNYALSHATNHSLILFDEVGRGTATFDGMALAQAIIEYVNEKIKAITLFSTHYHELTNLKIDGLVNLHASVVEQDNKVTFLYKMIKGAANKSYGINVARLANLPEELLSRASDILKIKESNGNVIVEAKAVTKEVIKVPDYVKEIEEIDPLQMSPMESLNFLYELSKKIKAGK